MKFVLRIYNSDNLEERRIPRGLEHSFFQNNSDTPVRAFRGLVPADHGGILSAERHIKQKNPFPEMSPRNRQRDLSDGTRTDGVPSFFGY